MSFCSANKLNYRDGLLAALLILLLLRPPAAAAGQLEVRALVVPEQEAVLASRIKGRIVQLQVRAGERFRKGQPLVELDCEILKAELQKARLDLEAAIETHAANLRLQEFGATSELEVALSSARRKRAQAEVLLKETETSMCIIEAPFDGRVVERKARRYESIGPDDPLLEILDDSRLKLHLLIPSHWLTWLKTGQVFSIRIDETGKKYQARITGLGARVNPVNQTLPVEGAIQGSHPELLAGMSGLASFSPDQTGK